MSTLMPSTLAFIQNLGGSELLLILFLVLLLFGAKRLPELARSFGKAIREFKKSTHEIEETIHEAMHAPADAPKKSATPEAPQQTTHQTESGSSNKA